MVAIDSPGFRTLLLGNEAIARGAIEAGVNVATGYPGTPSTEIIETLAEVAKELGFYVEWSVNEKVAFEVAYAASMCGLRAITAMKHVGLNVAMDPLMTAGYTGVRGGFVIVSADDASCHSSQNEQDNRIVGLHAYIPVFEPSNVQEAKDMTKDVFEFSEKYETPVILRTTTRLSHSRGPVTYGNITKGKDKGEFIKDSKRWVVIPAHARIRREIMVKRWEEIIKEIDEIKYNMLELVESNVGIIASGLAYSHVIEALKTLKLNGKVILLKVSTPIPIPERLTLKLLESSSKVLVVEELEPIVENEVKKLAFNNNLRVKIVGKELVPLTGELTLSRVLKAIAAFLKVKIPERFQSTKALNAKISLPPRPPVLCAGCPHRATFYAIKKAANLERVKAIYPSDIGCYTLGVLSPLEAVDTTICMGGSVGLGNGFAHFQNDVVIATIGDSTFYHAGIPGLINAVYNKAPMVLVVLDNKTTAMTGHQPHPGTGVTALGEHTVNIPIEDVAKAVGVKFIEIVDPYNLKTTVKSLRNAIKFVIKNRSPAVVIARRVCALLYVREVRRKGDTITPYTIDYDKCTGCRVCTDHFSCPAIYMVDGKVSIDKTLCIGCGVCSEVCPYKAIVKEGE